MDKWYPTSSLSWLDGQCQVHWQAGSSHSARFGTWNGHSRGLICTDRPWSSQMRGQRTVQPWAGHAGGENDLVPIWTYGEGVRAEQRQSWCAGAEWLDPAPWRGKPGAWCGLTAMAQVGLDQGTWSFYHTPDTKFVNPWGSLQARCYDSTTQIWSAGCGLSTPEVH